MLVGAILRELSVLQIGAQTLYTNLHVYSGLLSCTFQVFSMCLSSHAVIEAELTRGVLLCPDDPNKHIIWMKRFLISLKQQMVKEPQVAQQYIDTAMVTRSGTTAKVMPSMDRLLRTPLSNASIPLLRPFFTSHFRK